MRTVRAFIGAVSLVLGGLSICPPASAGLFGPSTYDECITESMKGVTSDVAARAILKSCRERFPAPPPPPVRELATAELAKLRLSGFRMPAGLMGTIQNDNASTTVTRVVLAVTTKVKGKVTTREYLFDVRAEPSGSGDFMGPIQPGDPSFEPEVRIVSATGY